jgi:hypothetical protein
VGGVIHSILPGERDLSPDEVQRIREMRAAGRSLEAIARSLPDLAPSQDEAVMRLAALLAPKRPPPARPAWKGRKC